jgi:hypothetical protein
MRVRALCVVVVLLAIVGLAVAQINSVVGGAFFAADGNRFDGITAYTHSGQSFLPTSGIAHAAGGGGTPFAGQTAAISSTGAMWWKGSGGATYAPPIMYAGNVSSPGVFSIAARWAGSATIFSLGRDVNPPQGRTYGPVVDVVQSLAVDDSANSLLVCVNPPGSTITPTYLSTGFPSPSQFPSTGNSSALPPQLLEFPTSVFSNQVMTAQAFYPTIITPSYTLNGFAVGVDCTTLHSVNGYTFIRANAGGPFFQRAPGSAAWTQITGINFIASGSIATPSSPLRFAFSGNVPIPYLYSSDPNTSPSGNATISRNIWVKSGNSWTSLMIQNAFLNVVLYDWTVSPVGGVYMTFQSTGTQPVPYTFPYSVDSYVFKVVSGGYWNPVAPLWRLYNSDNTGMCPLFPLLLRFAYSCFCPSRRHHLRQRASPLGHCCPQRRLPGRLRRPAEPRHHLHAGLRPQQPGRQRPSPARLDLLVASSWRRCASQR